MVPDDLFASAQDDTEPTGADLNAPLAVRMRPRTVEEIVALGMDPEKPRRSAPRAGRYSPQLDDLAGRLSDRLDTRVKINLGQRKGRMTIEFASMEDLERVLGQMGVEADID